MRKLSTQFMSALQDDKFLAPLVNEVIYDKDLDLQIRKEYLNIYYKGNSLLKLSRKGAQYKVEIDRKFCTGLYVPSTLDPGKVADFLALIPALKVNIVRFGNRSLETEYEQLIIRANNSERRNNSDYFILDRQYSLERYRFDLISFYWPTGHRKRNQEVPLCLMEVKFALNRDIQQLHDQIEGYYNLIKQRGPQLADEYQGILDQKLELGLFDRRHELIDAMKTLRISPDIEQLRFRIILVDYNPYSEHLNLDSLKSLSFADKIQLFYSGFAMWDINSKTLDVPTTTVADTPFGAT
jgi:hypothetical protein